MRLKGTWHHFLRETSSPLRPLSPVLKADPGRLNSLNISPLSCAEDRVSGGDNRLSAVKKTSPPPARQARHPPGPAGQRSLTLPGPSSGHVIRRSDGRFLASSSSGLRSKTVNADPQPDPGRTETPWKGQRAARREAEQP